MKILLSENQIKSLFGKNTLKKMMLEQVSLLVEKEIEVGSKLEDKLKFINTPLSKKNTRLL